MEQRKKDNIHTTLYGQISEQKNLFCSRILQSNKGEIMKTVIIGMLALIALVAFVVGFNSTTVERDKIVPCYDLQHNEIQGVNCIEEEEMHLTFLSWICLIICSLSITGIMIIKVGE